MNQALLIYPILFLIFIFCKASLSKGGGASSSFLSLDQAKMIRAAACIGIILHHVTQQVTSYGRYDKGPVTLFNDIGFLFTALFFFFSGYGLITSLKNRPDYLKRFLPNRLPKVLIPFWVINALGVALEVFAYGVHTTLPDALCDIFGLTLINSNGWFIVEITIFYLFFYVFFRLIRNRDAALLCLCLSVIAVMFFSFHAGHDPQGNQSHWFRGEWWYNSTVTFLFGLLAARFRNSVIRFFERAYFLLLPAAAALTVLTLQRSVAFVRRGGYYQDSIALVMQGGSSRGSLSLAARTLCWQSAACIAWTLLILLLSMRITIGNRALRYISTISTELFLIHGYFVSRIFGPVRMNDFLRCAAVLTASIITTALMSPLIRHLVSSVTRLLNRLASSVEASLSAAVRAKREEAGIRDHTKRNRILRAAGLLALAAIFVLIPLGLNLKTKAEFNAERALLREADVGDIVLFGHFETDPSGIGKERLSWIVIGKEEGAEDGTLLLLSAFGIAPGAYHHSHEEVSWEDCDLRKRLNSDEFMNIFSRYEKELLVPKDGDVLTLLSAEELQEVFPEKSGRFLAATESAIRQGVNSDRLSHYKIWFDNNYCYSWWWLKQIEGQKSVTAPIVEMDGTLRMNEKAVNKPNGAIRPMLRVRI